MLRSNTFMLWGKVTHNLEKHLITQNQPTNHTVNKIVNEHFKILQVSSSSSRSQKTVVTLRGNMNDLKNEIYDF